MKSTHNASPKSSYQDIPIPIRKGRADSLASTSQQGEAAAPDVAANKETKQQHKKGEYDEEYNVGWHAGYLDGYEEGLKEGRKEGRKHILDATPTYAWYDASSKVDSFGEDTPNLYHLDRQRHRMEKKIELVHLKRNQRRARIEEERESMALKLERQKDHHAIMTRDGRNSQDPSVVARRSALS